MRDAKASLRSWARSQAPVSEEESAATVAVLRRWLAGLPPCDVLTYLSMSGEVRAEQVADGDRHRYLTTRTPPAGLLTVHPIDSPREVHPLGFEQPVAEAEEVDPGRVGVVLVPGLCFDRLGGRLGRGRGYYDRLLGALSSARRVGVTVERLVVERVPTESHDVAMTHIATEREVRQVGVR